MSLSSPRRFCHRGPEHVLLAHLFAIAYNVYRHWQTPQRFDPRVGAESRQWKTTCRHPSVETITVPFRLGDREYSLQHRRDVIKKHCNAHSALKLGARRAPSFDCFSYVLQSKVV
jgi:hypothetical protein